MAVCIFCGPTKAVMTKEHLWPEWLSEMFKAVGMGGYQVSRVKSQTGERDRWTAHGLDIVVGGVCKKCNCETLGELENDFVKPVLSRIVFGHSHVLTRLDQAALAAWITRLVMVEEFTGTHGQFFFSAIDRKWFIESLQAPLGTWMWLFRFQSRTGYNVGCTQHINKNGLNLKADRWTAATGVVGRFGFQFLLRRNNKGAPSRAGLDEMRPVLRRWAPATVQLWPCLGDLKWPPSHHLGDNTIQPFSDRWGGRSLGPRAAFR